MHISGHGGRKSHFLHAGLFPEQRRVKHCPGGEGKQHTVRRSGGVQHICQTFSGKLSLVADILHTDANSQDIQIIIHENQDPHDKRGQQRSPLIDTEFGYQCGKSKGSLRLLKQGDETSEQSADQENPYVVGQRGLQKRTPFGQEIASVHDDGRHDGSADQKFHTAPGDDGAHDDN